jgi:MFS family permease
MKNRLLRYLDIQPGEQQNFSILFMQTLLLGFATSFFFVSATSHFVKHAGVQNLPFAYLISGVIGFALVSLYKKVQSSAGLVFSYVSGLILYAVFCLVLYILYITQKQSHTTAVVLAYTGLVLIMPFTAIFTIGFSMMSLQVFSFAQSKRLLAIVGTGETVAAIIAFVSVPFLMKFIGDSLHLLPASAVLVLLALLPLRQLVRHNKEKLSHVVRAQKKKARFDLSFFRKEKFFTAIMLFTFFSVLAIYLADYGYLIAVKYFSVQTEIETASIVAVIFSVIKSGELLFSFLSRAIQSKYGMRVSLLLLPCLLILFSAFAIGSSLLGTDPLFLLFFLIINKFNERVIRKGITTPSMKVIYQVTEPAERAQLQTSIEGIFSQVATIAAGGLLMLISLAYASSPGNTLKLLNLVTIVCLVVYVGWMLVSMEVFARYKQKINSFLFHHKPSADTLEKESLSVEKWLMTMKASGNWSATGEVYSINTSDRAQLLSVILHYNPALKDYIQEQDSDPEMFYKRIVRIYFNNDHFFSRIAIIWFFGFLPALEQSRFFKEVYQLSNQVQRLLLVRMFNKQLHSGMQSESFYFISLVQDCAREAIQLESAIDDLAALEDRRLPNQLQVILARQKNILLELLKLIYDADAISVIQSVINQHDSSEEHQHFAVELLSNILKPGTKEYVLPVFEPLPFQAKRNKLGSLFFMYELPVAERLKDVSMMDVKLINPYAKQLAMQTYGELTGDKQWLRAFENSNWNNLRHCSAEGLAENRNEQTEDGVEESLNTVIEPSYVSLYHHYSTGSAGDRHLADVVFKGKEVKLDTIGLAMLFAI